MKRANRWMYIMVGILAMMLGGVVYTWSLFSLPVSEEFPTWTQAQLSFTFTLVMFCFGFGNMGIGLLAEKIDRITSRMKLFGIAVLFFLAFFVSSCAYTPVVLYAGFGILGGLAAGACFNTVLSTVSLWFPDKPGLASGLLLMGFGFSSFFMGKIFQATLPKGIGTWRQSFVIIGVVGAIVLVLCAAVICKPNDTTVLPTPVKKKSTSCGAELSPMQLIRRRDFHFYYIWLTLETCCGVIIVAQASGMAREASPLLDSATLSTVVGVLSVFNGLGRIIVGELFDRFGYVVAIQTVNGSYLLAAVVLLVALQWENIPLVVVGFICAGMGYGGAAPTNSTFLSSRYGMRHYSLNLAVCTTCSLIASVGSTISGAMYDTTHSYQSTCLLIAVLVVICIGLSAAIMIYDRRKQ